MIFFITLFRYFTIVLFFTLHFFSYSQGMETRERAHCARSVFPFIIKKKKNYGTQTSRSAATTAFPSVSRKSPYASSDCVATLKRFASQAGFSDTVAGQLALCRRKSTRLNYQARWGKFRKCCRDFHHRSSEPTIPKIAEFFTFLFKTEKAAVSTIKGYRAMLSSVF